MNLIEYKIWRKLLLFHSIDINDSNNFKQCDDKQRHRAHVAVKDLHPVVPRTQGEDERRQEGHQAEDRCGDDGTNSASVGRGHTLTSPKPLPALPLTCYDLIRDPLGQYFKVFEGCQDSLNIAKHGGEAQAEEHDEEQNGPDL